MQTAVLLFTTRTLLRSRQHRVILSFYLGVGFAVALAYIKFPLGQHGPSRFAASGQAIVPFFAASMLMTCVVLAILVFFRANNCGPIGFSPTELRLRPSTPWRFAVRFLCSVWFLFGLPQARCFFYFSSSHRGRTPFRSWTSRRYSDRTHAASAFKLAFTVPSARKGNLPYAIITFCSSCL